MFKVNSLFQMERRVKIMNLGPGTGGHSWTCSYTLAEYLWVPVWCYHLTCPFLPSSRNSLYVYPFRKLSSTCIRYILHSQILSYNRVRALWGTYFAIHFWVTVPNTVPGMWEVVKKFSFWISKSWQLYIASFTVN